MSNRQIQQQPGGRDVVQESQGTVGGGKLNLNKKTLMAGGAGVVVLLALVASRGGKGGGGGSQQFAPYDSTASDQYNDLQNQLEDIQRQIDSGQVTPGTPTTPPATPASPKPTPKPKPWPPNIPGVPKHQPKPKTVTVHNGDTLSGIAKKYGVSMTTIKKLNPVYWTNKKYDNGNKIWSGDKVRVK